MLRILRNVYIFSQWRSAFENCAQCWLQAHFRTMWRRTVLGQVHVPANSLSLLENSPFVGTVVRQFSVFRIESGSYFGIDLSGSTFVLLNSPRTLGHAPVADTLFVDWSDFDRTSAIQRSVRDLFGFDPPKVTASRLFSSGRRFWSKRIVNTCGLACYDEVARSVAGRGRSCRSDLEPSLTIRSVVGTQPVMSG